MKRIVAALMLAMLGAQPALAEVKAGVAAWGRKDYAAAVAEWRGPAAAGDADAQYNLGQAYRRGLGVAADPAQAESWYRKAAAQGHVQAQASLALMLFTSADRKDAFDWLEKAATRGEPRAQYVLGTALFNGEGVEKNWPRAYAMMSRAAEAGVDAATRSLAQMEGYLSPAQKRDGTALAKKIAEGENVPASLRQRAPGTRAVSVAAATPAAPPESAEAADSAPAAKPDKPVAKPDKKKAAEAKPAKKRDPMDGWRVQLGAFGKQAAAKAYWTKFSGKAGLKELEPLYATRGGLTRLQAGPLEDRDAAEQACKAAKKAGGACLVIAP